MSLCEIAKKRYNSSHRSRIVWICVYRLLSTTVFSHIDKSNRTHRAQKNRQCHYGWRVQFEYRIHSRCWCCCCCCRRCCGWIESATTPFARARYLQFGSVWNRGALIISIVSHTSIAFAYIELVLFFLFVHSEIRIHVLYLSVFIYRHLAGCVSLK